MKRIARNALFSLALLGLVSGTLSACGGDDHAGHEHKPGEKHDDAKETKPK